MRATVGRSGSGRRKEQAPTTEPQNAYSLNFGSRRIRGRVPHGPDGTQIEISADYADFGLQLRYDHPDKRTFPAKLRLS